MNAWDWLAVSTAGILAVLYPVFMWYLHRSKRKYEALCQTICDNLTQIDLLHEQDPVLYASVEEALRCR